MDIMLVQEIGKHRGAEGVFGDPFGERLGALLRDKLIIVLVEAAPPTNSVTRSLLRIWGLGS